MKSKKIFYLLVLVLTVGVSLGLSDTEINSVLQDVENKKNIFNADLATTQTVIVERVGEETSVKKIKMFRRDKEDKFVILILEPAIQKGEGYLQAEGNLWFYDPETRNFAHTSSKESFQDTDAKNSDFRKSSLTKDYTVEGYSEAVLGKYEVYIIELKAKSDEASSPYLKMWVQKDDHLILKLEEYSLTRRLMRTALYPKYTKAEGNFIPSRIIYIDEITPGNRTQILLEDVSFAVIPDYVFTKAYVEKVSR